MSAIIYTVYMSVVRDTPFIFGGWALSMPYQKMWWCFVPREVCGAACLATLSSARRLLGVLASIHGFPTDWSVYPDEELLNTATNLPPRSLSWWFKDISTRSDHSCSVPFKRTTLLHYLRTAAFSSSAIVCPSAPQLHTLPDQKVCQLCSAEILRFWHHERPILNRKDLEAGISQENVCSAHQPFFVPVTLALCRLIVSAVVLLYTTCR